MSRSVAEQEDRARGVAEARQREAAATQAQEQEAQLKQQSLLLLSQFDGATGDGDPHGHGYLLQDLWIGVEAGPRPGAG